MESSGLSSRVGLDMVLRIELEFGVWSCVTHSCNKGHTNGGLRNESWSWVGSGSKNRTGVRSSELCYMKL